MLTIIFNAYLYVCLFSFFLFILYTSASAFTLPALLALGLSLADLVLVAALMPETLPHGKRVNILNSQQSYCC